MAAPVTKTDIVNAAAALLGSSERVTSMDGAGNLARHAAALWDSTAEAMLADHPWNFAIRRAALNRTTAPAFGYLYAYALPADCLRALSFADGDGCAVLAEVEAGAVLTDAESLFIRYIGSGHVDDPAAWPAHLVKAMELALAMAMAEALTGASGMANALDERLDRAMRRARRVDGRESQTMATRDRTSRGGFAASLHAPWNR